MRALVAVLLLGCALPALSEDNRPTHLEELLERVKTAEKREQDLRNQRLKRFIAENGEQERLLQRTREHLAAERKRSERLKARFEENEKTLARLESELEQRTGDLGEVFGAVRQSSKDLAEYVRESLVSVRDQERSQWLRRLGENKKLPDTDELERLWRLMKAQIVESGRVVRIPATVVDTDGKAARMPIIRIGVFNALDERGRYLRYQPGTGRLVVLPRQPSSSARETASEFARMAGERSETPHAEIALDPTRGMLLGMLVDAPDLVERLHQGGAVGYIIIALGAFGVLVAAVRLAYLSRVGRRVRRQLNNPSCASHDNPLGRILAVAEEHRDGDPANLELQIDEAVLRETPRLTRGEGLVKLLAGVAPLLGLLGTVVGMIVTFQAISLFGTGDPKLMANGISQALVTTALGLIVAIPLLFTHSLVASRSRALVQILDEQSAGLIAVGREIS